eukprot:TRINITY_DN105479_c0_g1_i1.p1 TRINITY_DN105479_c0_g1~~TRINITY_DN105479_c0_g1_i1.p1  ORF type:complete len:706 (-),score=122.43 TRINITY_DN105479_c0_g1_i1:73-2190(-)
MEQQGLAGHGEEAKPGADVRGEGSPDGQCGAPSAGLRYLEVRATRPDQLSLLDQLPEFRRNGRFCDIRLRSREGTAFSAHRLIIALASEALASLVGGAFTEHRRRHNPEDAQKISAVPKENASYQGGSGAAAMSLETAENLDRSEGEKLLEVELDVSAEALGAFLDFIYVGAVRVPLGHICELLRFAHMYALQGLLDLLEEAVTHRMHASACAELLPESKLLALESLEVACHQFALAHFEDCVATQAFTRWSASLLLSLVQSDDLRVRSEEDVLRAVWRWHRADPERSKETALLMSGVRYTLLAEPTVAMLQVRAQSMGFLGVELLSLMRRSQREVIGKKQPLRNCSKHYWADFGVSISGGIVVAGGAEGDEDQQIYGPFSLAVVEGEACQALGWAGCGAGGQARGEASNANRLYLGAGPSDRALLIADKCSGRVVSWPVQDDKLQAVSGKTIAGRGAQVEGANDLGLFFKIDLDASQRLLVASCGEADGSSRVLRFDSEHGGKSLQVPLLEDTVRDVSAGPNGSIFILDNDGTRVLKRTEDAAAGDAPQMVVVAGNHGRGPQADQLSDAEYMVATEDGSVYVSDKANHRVQRWDPGATAGVTVAGGNSAGAGPHQLNEPWGLCVTAERKIYIADMRNDRVVRWDPGSQEGVVVAGGYGAGAEPHQLSRPTDVALDSRGTLYIADWGNHRVVRWGPPPDPRRILE